MGKATVYEHLGDGKYSVLYTPEVADVLTRVAELESIKIDLDAQLNSTDGLIDAQAATTTVYDDASNAFFSALDAWAACASQLPPCANQSTLMGDVNRLGRDRAESGIALNTTRAVIADNRAKYYSTTQEIAFLNSTKNGSGGGLMEVWCVDYDENNPIPDNTVAGTIETYGAKGGYQGGYLPRKWVNLQSSTTPTYSASRDHCVKPLSGIKTAAMFYNWCQWLYVMANNPQHAVGVVLSKFNEDQDYLDVEMFGTTPGASQPAGYPFNGDYSVTLLNVPVDYLSCGARIFDEGDDVVIRFDGINRSNPTVIGFAESPKHCTICVDPYVFPWHGLATNNVIALPNGGTHSFAGYPQHGAAYLIDSDKPDETPNEISGETYKHYAFMSGQFFKGVSYYGYIHKDTGGKCWNIIPSYTFPSTNTVVISFQIKSLESSSYITKTATVTCEHIELTYATGNPVNEAYYTLKAGTIEDVWTDGKKALIGILLFEDEFVDIVKRDLFSLIEVTIGGIGGSDGSGLTLSAVEVMGQSSLTTMEYERQQVNPTGIPIGDVNYYLLNDFYTARFGYYNSAGSVKALRIRHYLYEYQEGTFGYLYDVYQYINVGMFIYENSSEIDKLYLQSSSHITRTQEGESIVNTDVSLGSTWSGSLSSYITASPNFALDIEQVLDSIRGIYSGVSGSKTYESIYDETAGINVMESKSAAIYYVSDDGVRHYGTISTPLGTKTYSGDDVIDTATETTANGGLHFAWDRKTGDYAFSLSPICYF